MKVKERLILSAVLIGTGSFMNLYFTASLHGLMSRQYRTLVLLPIGQCITGLIEQRQQRLLFLAFEGMIFLGCILFFIQNSRSYQSDLVKVTEDIETPVAVGQYQHGSSRWLKEQEKDQIFDVFWLDSSNAIVKQLIQTGYEGLDFLNRSNHDKQATDNGGRPKDRGTAPIIVPIENKETREKGHEMKGEEEGFELVEYQFDGSIEKQAMPKPWKVPQLEWDRKNDPYCLIDRGGIVIGMKKEGGREKIHYISDDSHTLTIGATRSGKTRTLVLQSICLMALSGESMVISDPKAELYEYTSAFLEKLQYDVICLDFKNPQKSSRYNLLQPVIDAVNRGDTERAQMYAWDITNILVGDNTSNEKIWENGEKSTIAAAILCVVVDNARRPEYQNLTNVYWFLAEMCKTIGNKTPMQEYVKRLKPGHPARALLSISDVAPSRTKGSFYTSALTTLRLFTSKSIYAITHQSDRDISDLGRKKQALFLFFLMRKRHIIRSQA